MILQVEVTKRETIEMNRKRTGLRIVFAMLIMLLAFHVTAAAKVVIEETDYEGNGKVELDFKGKVRYKKVRLTVKNAKGKKVKASITKKGAEELEFVIRRPEQDETYSFTISGIRGKKDKKFGKVTGKIYIPVRIGNVSVETIEYDPDDKEVEFEFSKKVKWQNPYMSVWDSQKNYVLKIAKTEEKMLEASVSSLQKGRLYYYCICGIAKKTDQEYSQISGTFIA